MGLLETISATYKIVKKENPKFEHLKVSGMNFEVSSYEIEGIGNLGVMCASGMMGLMKMESIVINPFEVDAPMLSTDHILAMGNDKLYLELFDTTLSSQFHNEPLEAIREKYSYIPEIPQKEHWYDYLHVSPCLFKATKKKNSQNQQLVEEYLTAYLKSLSQYEQADRRQKIAKAKAYPDGLVENGGPATDPFIKQYGKEFTREFFEKVLFGC